MMANNSSGARSVLYGKTIDHVLEQIVALADGSVVHFREMARSEIPAGETLEAACYRAVLGLALQHAAEIERRNDALVEQLKREGCITSAPVEAAFRAVRRHLFLPGTPLDQVYRDEAIPTKRERGVPISSSSQPAIMAVMLEQLGLRPGQRVLEVGAGTGYNAALMSHIVGAGGRVVTVDIDGEPLETWEDWDELEFLAAEGSVESGWVLLDYGDLMVHIFAPEQRDYYELEELWKEAPRVVKIQ